MSKIRIFEAFAGIGTQSMALERIKQEIPDFDYEIVGISEIDKYAIAAYNSVHDGVKNYGDIALIDWNDVPDFDLLTYSFPCGLEGTLVLTNNGYKDISRVTVGDSVMTHNNRYKEVVRATSRICDSHYLIKGVGCNLRLTAEHPLYVLRDNVEQWVKVKDLKMTDKVSYCVPGNSIYSELPNEYLWLLGRYVADGYVNKHLYNSVEFAIGKHKEEYFINHIPQDFKSKFKKFDKACYEYRIADKNLQELCLQFGNGSKNKRIPQWVIDLPNEQLDHFLDGYFSGDGHVRYRCGTKIQMFSTVSKELFLGLQLLILKRYNKVCSLSIREDKRKDTFNNTYNGQIAYSKRDVQSRIGFRVYVPIRSIEEIAGEVQVYNLEVEDDNSYTCDNVNTHNCTNISMAGRKEGLEEGSGTSSSLLWECRRAIETKRPKYLLLENVPALVNSKNIAHFNRWIEELASYGYTNYWQCLNSKDYGVPQSRNRIFVVSILDGGEYSFPGRIELTKCMNDMLEETVDERYYLRRSTIESIIEHCKRKQAEGCGFRFEPTDGSGIAKTINTKEGCRQTDNFIIQLGNVYPDTEKFKNRTMGRIYDVGGLCPTINCCGGGDREPKVFVDGTRIRKLTPRECFRLMGVSDSDIDKIQNVGISNTQQYKLAGNAIVVDVLYYIFKNLVL